jgi:hypothetical protein
VYTGVPNVCIDGIYVNVNDNYDAYRERFDERKVVPSPLVMDITLVTYDGATGEGIVNAMIYNEADATVMGQLRLVATGDDTVGTWGGFDHLSHTAIDIFPSAWGVPVELSPGESFETAQHFLIPDGWRDRACTIVGFVQYDETREVQQVATLSQVTPIELVSFSGRTTKDGVLLSWMTATEKENAGFRIYRVVNGETELLTPTMIPGAGTSAVPHQYGYVDEAVEPGTTYLYKLSDISLSGVERFHAPVSVTVPHTWGAPSVLHLEPVRPCPAVGEVTLSLSLPMDGDVKLSIYDVAGRVVRTVPAMPGQAGIYTTTWDLTDNQGHRVSPGLYVVKVAAGDEEVSGRIVVAQ